MRLPYCLPACDAPAQQVHKLHGDREREASQKQRSSGEKTPCAVAMTARAPACREPKRIQDLHNFSSIVCAVERVPKTSMIVTASLDGAIVAWSMESFEALFRMKAQRGVRGLRFIDATSFVFWATYEAHVIMLRHFFTTFMECNSPLAAIETPAPGILMCTCEVRFTGLHSHVMYV